MGQVGAPFSHDLVVVAVQLPGQFEGVPVHLPGSEQHGVFAAVLWMARETKLIVRGLVLVSIATSEQQAQVSVWGISTELSS